MQTQRNPNKTDHIVAIKKTNKQEEVISAKTIATNLQNISKSILIPGTCGKVRANTAWVLDRDRQTEYVKIL